MSWADPWTWLLVLGCAITIWFIWWLFHFGKSVHIERACELFRLQTERMESLFFSVASNTGKPRGLTWKRCVFTGHPEFLQDRHNYILVSLIPVQIEWEAIPDSDMEGVEAVPHPRIGCAVFQFRNGTWQTDGKVLFNLSPKEATERFQQQYVALHK